MVAPVRWPTPVPFTLTARSRLAVHSRQSGSIGYKAGVGNAPIAALSEHEPGEEKHGSKEPEHSCCTHNSFYSVMHRKSSGTFPV